MTERAQVMDTPEAIAAYQFVTRKAAVRLECAGMRRRGRPATVICREAYGITAKSRAGVLAAMNAIAQHMLIDGMTLAQAVEAEGGKLA